ncbi:nucleoside deaminase [Gordonia jinhuaensis]|uniref:tRNA-specific adenosine deaminase n=1 Tax=Gordonia jinhuaensis TaxID=1517702 RepID=A0A916THU2_9ACTN|nr:nucleoside deaminase [Gordonia jinhuaensis]GGB46145.1 tRNA-specific adenosine deaminase [Gordonia jinhuaensis]
MTDTDLHWLNRAIDVAASSRDHGNHPFGAVLVDADGNEVATAENSVVTDGDLIGHAETNLVRLAGQKFGADALPSMTLYTSTEPCAMCSGAVYWSGIGTVVFALSEAELADMTGADPENPTMALPCREVFAHGQRPTQVRGPFPIDAARAVHDGFWNKPE